MLLQLYHRYTRYRILRRKEGTATKCSESTQFHGKGSVRGRSTSVRTLHKTSRLIGFHGGAR
jgi:hypothetical protein